MSRGPTRQIGQALLGLTILEACSHDAPDPVAPWTAEVDHVHPSLRRATILALTVLASRLVGGEDEYLRLRALDPVQLEPALAIRIHPGAERDDAIDVVMYAMGRRARLETEQVRTFLRLCARLALCDSLKAYLDFERAWLLEHLRESG